MQVPYVIEIVSNNVSDDGEVLIGNKRECACVTDAGVIGEA